MLTQATRSAIRCFSTSVVARKTVTDSVKETADTVNKKLGKGLASAIEGTEHAAQVTKETIGIKSEKAKKTLDQAAETTKAKADVAGAKTKDTATKAKHNVENKSGSY